MTYIRIIAIALALALSACSTQVKRPTAAEQPKPVVKALESYAVELSPGAKSQLPDNVKFDTEAFTATLKRTLEARNLVAPDGDFRLKVVVQDIRVRGTFNAVMWGFMAGDDHLYGDAILENREGKVVYTYRVESSYALGGLAGGIDSTRLNWLYEDFSKHVADELAEKRDEKK
jgi:hypothetical protein